MQIIRQIIIFSSSYSIKHEQASAIDYSIYSYDLHIQPPPPLRPRDKDLLLTLLQHPSRAHRALEQPQWLWLCSGFDKKPSTGQRLVG